MKKFSGLTEILKEQVVPAIGCTEPIAVALAGAVCRKYNPGIIKQAEVTVSENVYKNGMGVGIPGAGGRKGLEMAAALGIEGGDPEAGLQVLRAVGPEKLELAEKLVKDDCIKVNYKRALHGVYVEATLVTDTGNSRVVIEDDHSRIVCVEKDGVAIINAGGRGRDCSKSAENLADYLFTDLLQFATEVPLEDIAFIADGISMNQAIAEVGLEKKMGMGLSHGLRELMADQVILDDLYFRVKMYTSAAADARMSGVQMPVMSSAGSGNHGITAILPVSVVGDQLGKTEEEVIRAVAFSHLITNYIKVFIGRLSPICGCTVAAGSGAAAGIAYLLGCDKEQISGAVKNMIGNLSGMICDGAKDGCSLKLGVSGGEALLAAQLAKHGYVIPNSDGIVGLTVEETVRNLGEVADPGMRETDSTILNVMLHKDKRCYHNRQ
ncbi:MAG: L-serine ammonia-lyase, iron-sulfur-dependent, subunit alpha [Halanaerobium sp.]|nr:L-serine ammonia-lyase, iron-sulfur-dependent, subunit alpha [Halanaerobium sp.]